MGSIRGTILIFGWYRIPVYHLVSDGGGNEDMEGCRACLLKLVAKSFISFFSQLC